MQNVRSSSAAPVGIRVLDGVFLQITDNITIDGATSVGLQILWGSRCAASVTGSGKLVAITGPSTVTSFWGLHVAYSSELTTLTANFNMTLTNVFIGIAYAIQSCVQIYQTPGALLMTNASTPAGSQGWLGTDQSTFSSRINTTLNHFTFGWNLNSLAYGEHDSGLGGTYTLTNVGTASQTSTGAIVAIF